MRAALAAIGLAVLAATPASGRSQAAADTTLCRDARAATGDSLACGGTIIRLYGITAPATDQPGFDEAREALEHMVRSRDVRCRIERRVHSRLDIGVCRVNGRDLAARLARDGHVRPTASRYSTGSGENDRSR